MPLELKVEPKLDEHSLSQFFRNAGNQFDEQGHEIGLSLSSGIARGLGLGLAGFNMGSGGYNLGSALSGLTTAFGSATESAGGLTSALGIAGVAGGVAAAGAATVIVTKQFYDMGAQWNEITDQLILRTGASTAAIESMKDSVRNIGAVTAAPLAEISRVLGDVTMQFHQTGAAANALTESVVNIGKNLNQQVDMREMGRLFRLFDVKDAADQLQALNELYSVSASTRIPINELTSSLENVGRSAKDMGLDLGQAAGLIVTLEDAGLSWTRLGPGLQMAMSNWAKSGREPAEALRDTITQMRALIDAGKDVEAQHLAYTQFGRRAWLDLYNAVHDNKLGIDELNQALDSHGRNIGEDTRRVEHFGEEWQKYVNLLKGEVEPAATRVFDVFNTGLGQVLQVIRANIDALDVFTHKLQQLPLISSIFGTTETGQVEGGLPPIDTTIPSPWSTTHPVPGAPSPFDTTDTHRAPTGGPYIFPKGEFDTKPGRTERPEVPYGPGYGEPPQPGESYEDWRHRQQQLEDEHNLAEANARLEQIRADNNHTQAQLIAAQNAVLQAQERLQQDQLKPERQPAAQKPEVPYGPGFGLPPRPGQTPEQYSNEQTYLEAQHKTAQAQAELQAVQSNSSHTADELTKAQNNVVEAQRNQYQAQLRLNDAVHQGTNQLQDFGAKIDADFGASQGLPGLAENLTKFLANLAFAPVFGALGGAQAATGVPGSRAGSGIVGMIANAAGIGQQQPTGSPLGQIAAGPFGQIGVGPFGISPQVSGGQTAGNLGQIAQAIGLPYGLTADQVAAGQFPPEITQLGAMFNLKPSTYPGHQSTATTAHSQLGVPIAPNPQGLNRGIDWMGSQADMDRFADFLISSGMPGLEQVIHRDPNTGRDYSYPSGVNYPFGEETGMVHTRFSQLPGAMGVRSQPGRLPAGVSGSEASAYQAMINAGFAPSEWPALKQLITRESGFNPAARNPSSGAFGMYQFLGHQSDKYGGLGAYSPDPRQQSVAGIQYIKDRYGSPANAWSFWQSHNWYQEGGDIKIADPAGSGGGQLGGGGSWSPGYRGAQPWWGMPPLIANPGGGPYEHGPGETDLGASGGNIPGWWRRAWEKANPPGWQWGISRQEGGLIPGGGAVPIIAHEGEHVFTATDVNAMGGQGAVYDFRAGLHQPKAGPPAPQMAPGAVMPTFGGTMGGPMPAISPIGAAAPSAGHGAGFSVTGGGLVGIAESIPSTVANMAIQAAAASAAGAEFGGAIEDLMRFDQGGEVPSVLGPSSGGGIASAQSGVGAPGGGSPSGAIISAAINIGMSELNNAIGYGGRAIGAVASGLQQTFGPDQFAQSKMGQQSWVTRFIGGIMGAQPQLPNIAGMISQPPPAAPGTMPGTSPFGSASGKTGGPLVNIENYHAGTGGEEHANQIGRYVDAAQTAYSSASLTGGR